MLPNLYYLCTQKVEIMNASRNQIMDYATTHGSVNATGLMAAYGMKPTTARQYLSTLAKENVLVRIGQGEYALPQKQAFSYVPSQKVKDIYKELKSQLPFTDFCVYDGSVFSSIQHHLSINHAIYVETNRDAVESVFARLKEKHKKVYRQPDTTFVNDYIDLRETCIIVKTLVTESPLTDVQGIRVPTLEKLLVDTLKDSDFDYMQGAESLYMYQMAFELFTVNTQRLMRYAKRRGIGQEIKELITQAK